MMAAGPAWPAAHRDQSLPHGRHDRHGLSALKARLPLTAPVAAATASPPVKTFRRITPSSWLP